MIIVVVLFLIISLGFIVYYIKGYQKDRDYYEDMRESVISTEPVATDNSVDTEVPCERVDFDVIQGNIADIKSWITIPGTAIDYPLMYCDNNDYYLHHNAGGEDSKAGSIFVDYRNQPDMSDEKTIIYGHSMKDGSMFHTLHSYAKTDFAKNHDKLYIYDDTGAIHTYELLATAIVAADNQTVYGLSEGNNVRDILASANAIQYTEYNGNSIVVLSTCSTKNRRRITVFQLL